MLHKGRTDNLFYLALAWQVRNKFFAFSVHAKLPEPHLIPNSSIKVPWSRMLSAEEDD